MVILVPYGTYLEIFYDFCCDKCFWCEFASGKSLIQTWYVLLLLSFSVVTNFSVLMFLVPVQSLSREVQIERENKEREIDEMSKLLKENAETVRLEYDEKVTITL